MRIQVLTTSPSRVALRRSGGSAPSSPLSPHESRAAFTSATTSTDPFPSLATSSSVDETELPITRAPTSLGPVMPVAPLVVVGVEVAPPPYLVTPPRMVQEVAGRSDDEEQMSKI